MRNPGQVLDQRNRITRKTSYGPIASPVESVVAMFSPLPPLERRRRRLLLP